MTLMSTLAWPPPPRTTTVPPSSLMSNPPGKRRPAPESNRPTAPRRRPSRKRLTNRVAALETHDEQVAHDHEHRAPDQHRLGEGRQVRVGPQHQEGDDVGGDPATEGGQVHV